MDCIHLSRMQWIVFISQEEKIRIHQGKLPSFLQILNQRLIYQNISSIPNYKPLSLEKPKTTYNSELRKCFQLQVKRTHNATGDDLPSGTWHLPVVQTQTCRHQRSTLECHWEPC